LIIGNLLLIIDIGIDDPVLLILLLDWNDDDTVVKWRREIDDIEIIDDDGVMMKSQIIKWQY